MGAEHKRNLRTLSWKEEDAVANQANGGDETDLPRLLAGLQPRLSEMVFAFATNASLKDILAQASIVGTFIEDEGLTIVGPLDEVGFTKVEHGGGWAKINLRAQSSAASAGLTAKVATILADHGISPNIIAAFFHDHIFVPWDRRYQAMTILQGFRTREA